MQIMLLDRLDGNSCHYLFVHIPYNFTKIEKFLLRFTNIRKTAKFKDFTYQINQAKQSNSKIYICKNFQLRKKCYSWDRKKIIKVFYSIGTKGLLEILGAKFTELKY